MKKTSRIIALEGYGTNDERQGMHIFIYSEKDICKTLTLCDKNQLVLEIIDDEDNNT